MSTMIGAVWVLPQGAAADLTQIEATLGSWLSGSKRRPSVTGDYWDLSGVADASLFRRTDEVGFDLLVVRFSSGALADNPECIQTWIERGFNSVRGLGAMFGLLTRYDDHFEPAWLREHVLIPVLMEEWDTLRAQPFEAVWVANLDG